MVDGVELAVIDQVLHIGRLDDGDTVVFQQRGNPSDEPVCVGNVRQNVIGMNDVRSPALRCELNCEGGSEECQQRVDSLGACDLYGTGSGIYSQHRYAVRLIILQKIAIVTGKLHHQAFRPELAFLDAGVDVDLGMPQQGIGEGGEIRIVRGEQCLGRHRLQDLYQGAGRTERDVERIERCFAEIGSVEETVRQRQVAQRQKYRQSLAATGAATGL